MCSEFCFSLWKWFECIKHMNWMPAKYFKHIRSESYFIFHCIAKANSLWDNVCLYIFICECVSVASVSTPQSTMMCVQSIRRINIHLKNSVRQMRYFFERVHVRTLNITYIFIDENTNKSEWTNECVREWERELERIGSFGLGLSRHR